MKRITLTVLMFALIFAFPARAQEPVDQTVIARIKQEGFQNSQVMETLFYLADVYGPRLAGSPNLKAASVWSRDKMSSWGLQNAQMEPWGTFGPGWSVERFSVEMVEPQYVHVTAYPLAWTPSTKGVVSGRPIVVEVKSKEDFEKYRGKLKGAIVMNGKPGKPPTQLEAKAKRYNDQDLLGPVQAIDPGAKGFDSDTSPSYWEEEKEWLEILAKRNEIIKFFHDEGAAMVLEPSRFDPGNLLVQGFYDLNPDHQYPAFVIASEHYGRIARLLEKDLPVKLEINLQTRIHEQDSTAYNVIGELPGADPKLKNEVVMIGGHLDSWHSGTGATDNAAGCAVVMEAIRILKTIGVKPRRTIRVALWGGEEHDYFGSMGYVKKHFGDPKTMQLKPEHETLAGYFNLDNGSGKIRGVFLQGNETVRPIFEAYLKPFNYLGASTLTTLNTGGTDHMSFDAIGLPGFQFIQDPLDYSTRTHHSSLDVYESVLPDDLKQAAVIVASFAYHTAMRDEKLPRKPLPKAQP